MVKNYIYIFLFFLGLASFIYFGTTLINLSDLLMSLKNFSFSRTISDIYKSYSDYVMDDVLRKYEANEIVLKKNYADLLEAFNKLNSSIQDTINSGFFVSKEVGYFIISVNLFIILSLFIFFYFENKLKNLPVIGRLFSNRLNLDDFEKKINDVLLAFDKSAAEMKEIHFKELREHRFDSLAVKLSHPRISYINSMGLKKLNIITKKCIEVLVMTNTVRHQIYYLKANVRYTVALIKSRGYSAFETLCDSSLTAECLRRDYVDIQDLSIDSILDKVSMLEKRAEGLYSGYESRFDVREAMEAIEGSILVPGSV